MSRGLLSFHLLFFVSITNLTLCLSSCFVLTTFLDAALVPDFKRHGNLQGETWCTVMCFIGYGADQKCRGTHVIQQRRREPDGAGKDICSLRPVSGFLNILFNPAIASLHSSSFAPCYFLSSDFSPKAFEHTIFRGVEVDHLGSSWDKTGSQHVAATYQK